MDDNRLEQAAALYKQGKKPQAAMVLGEIVQQEPDNAKAWFGLALSLDEPDRIIFCLKKVLALEPSHQKAKQLLEKLQPEQKPLPGLHIREPIFWIAWVLFLICMLVPQGGTGDRYLGAVTAPGIGLVALATAFLPLFLINPVTIFTPLTALALGICMSALLFIVSPFLLRTSWSSQKKMHDGWLIYMSLNLLCIFLFLLSILKIPVVGQIDPKNLDNQLLPGFIVWIGAQITLTAAAFAKLITPGTSNSRS